MPVVSVADVGTLGIIKDVDPLLLPPSAWTDGRNVRFANGAVNKMLGYVSVATPSVAPLSLVPVTKGGVAYWVYAGTQKVYSWDGTTHANITPQDNDTPPADVNFTGSATDIWTGGVLQDVLVLSNGVDAPQAWLSTDLQPLDWDSGNTWSDKGYSCKALRPYKNFLVALRWNDGSVEYPHSVYWSNQADPGTTPSDWDYADAANEAGINELAATQGRVVDGEQLRDQFAVYKEDAIHLMQYVGGKSVMSFRDVSRTTGMLAPRCAKELYGRHFVFADSDIILHDGQSIESVADKKVRSVIFSGIDPSYYLQSFVYRNLVQQEMWCCYTETGSTRPSRAAVWNWKDNTWTFRTLPGIMHLGYGNYASGVEDQSWDADSATWRSDSAVWDETLYNPSQLSTFGAASANLHKFDYGYDNNGSSMTSYVTRVDLVLDGQPTLKQVKAIYPRVSGSSLQVSIGSKYDVEDGYTWEGPYTFTPATDSKVRVRSTGRFHAVKFTFTNSEGAPALLGYDLEYEVVGRR